MVIEKSDCAWTWPIAESDSNKTVIGNLKSLMSRMGCAIINIRKITLQAKWSSLQTA